jgi:uncharacterized protein (DUF433 family)
MATKTKTRSKSRSTKRVKSKATAAGRRAAKSSPGRRRSQSHRTEGFSRREAALLADVSLRSVDKAIEEKVVKPRRSARRASLDSGDVLAIALIARARLPLSAQAKRQINQWVHGILEEDTAEEAAELLLSEVLVLRYDETARALAARLFEYFENRERFIAADPGVMGGEPVIVGTRIPVRAVAARLAGGESIDDLCEDYPEVSRAAFEAALTYARAHPRRGRPARPWRDD